MKAFAAAVAMVTLHGGCSSPPPGFVAEALREAAKTCAEAGGTLVPVTPPALQAIDVNADGTREFVFDLEGSATCDGAASVFSCGSLGCPKTLYEQRDAKWRPIASIYTPALEAIELGSAVPFGYRDLLVSADKNERWHYEWQGSYYDRTYVEVLGFRVEFAESVHGLREVVTNTALLATPEASGAIVAQLEKGAEVAIVGTADGGYFYVSPCNACESGFVHESQLKP